MSEQTNTPRTNAAELDKAEFSDWGYGASGYCTADFARTLERELSAAQKRVERLEGALTQIINYADGSTDPGIPSVARAALKGES